MFAPMDTPIDFGLGRESSSAADAVRMGGCFDPLGVNSEVAAGLGSVLQAGLQSGIGGLPPDFAKGLGVAQPILTAGLGSILNGGAPDLGSLLSASSLMGMAGQFLPPQVGQFLPVAQALMAGDPVAMLSAALGKFIPPELQAVASAAMQGGVLSTLADAAFPPPGAPGSFADPSTAPVTSGAGLLAARIGDPHVCPAFDGPKPHVGGPITTGMPTVLIGGPPAARVGDMAACAGPPDVISTGESTVLIGNRLAARLTDSTAHGGKIVAGCPTVMIGKKAENALALLAKKCATSSHQSGVAGTTA